MRVENGAEQGVRPAARATLALAGGAVLFAACSPVGDPAEAVQAAPDVDAATISAAIKADVRATVEAFNARDAERAVRSNAADFLQMSRGQPNADNAANLANTRQQVADPALGLTIADEQTAVAQAGDMVFYSNRYTYTFTDPASGKPATETGNWVLIYRRQGDGTMKIFREIISDLPSG